MNHGLAGSLQRPSDSNHDPFTILRQRESSHANTRYESGGVSRDATGFISGGVPEFDLEWE